MHDGDKQIGIVNLNSLATFSTDKYERVPVAGSRGLIRLLCFQVGQRVPTHYHPKADEYFYVARGRGKVTFGEEEFDAGEGDIVRAPAGVRHRWVNTGKSLVLISMLVPPSSYKRADEAKEMIQV